MNIFIFLRYLSRNNDEDKNKPSGDYVVFEKDTVDKGIMYVNSASPDKQKGMIYQFNIINRFIFCRTYFV